MKGVILISFIIACAVIHAKPQGHRTLYFMQRAISDEEIKEMFNHYDTNKDGFLDRSEAIAAGYKEADVDAVIKKYGKDKANLAEFTAIVKENQ